MIKPDKVKRPHEITEKEEEAIEKLRIFLDKFKNEEYGSFWTQFQGKGFPVGLILGELNELLPDTKEDHKYAWQIAGVAMDQITGEGHWDINAYTNPKTGKKSKEEFL